MAVTTQTSPACAGETLPPYTWGPITSSGKDGMSVSDTVNPATRIIQTHKPSLVSEGLLKCNGAGWVGGGGGGRGEETGV